ncbi:polysaccharide ABC transporter ATP-binding protein [Gramella sp. MAR_2010_147]|uniref:ABC transporter ATP-binding protein n=1 Tax=Gramella sp. MAR_2010_147 TaxID=1250205 RepID=UPI00087BB4FF|nr:polysaccharide ABC transporter ATP-binding protein [Gramella sp. MAR_2010_147]SDS02338.1 lipopolysaccharide transport system ATP-binding protein [Gramella sp. MAR_2010_147]
MSIILKAENISKQYRLGTVGTGTLGDDLKRWWYGIRGKEDPFLKVGAVNERNSLANEDYVWALRDINFDVKQGEVLGIIGKNGAGKSTLLKLLSRVTSPTTGTIKTKGRIASLLEIGTGFHPELTGRENIFMNGAVLGMTRMEIKNKLEEIIAFSGCEKYIDTPVKRYSSGMTVRLGFAVAAHLEPEILVVDEVLAVGDAEFQKKAIGKMQDLSTGEGRTVLFVSHNMASIQNLCTRVMLLRNGLNEKIGFTDDVINYYLEKFRNTTTSKDLNERLDRKGNGMLKFLRFSFENENGRETNALQSGRNCHMNIEIINTTRKKISNVRISVGIDDNQSRRITLLDNTLTNLDIEFKPMEFKIIKIIIPKLPLQGGQYYFTLFSSIDQNIADWIINAGGFEVEFGDYFNTGKIVDSTQGNFLTHHKFSIISG